MEIAVRMPRESLASDGKPATASQRRDATKASNAGSDEHERMREDAKTSGGLERN